MDEDRFYARLHAAAVASWWTILIAALWLTAVWLIWMALLSCPSPTDDVVALWGGVNGEDIRPLMLLFMGAMKLILFTAILAAIFLSIWSHKLRPKPPAA